MKIAIAIALALLFSGIAEAKSVYVKPYVRKDGTYVQGHYRTSPNGSVSDNWSTNPNINPYTLKRGTVHPTPRVYYPQPYVYSPPIPAPPIPRAPHPSTVWQTVDD